MTKEIEALKKEARKAYAKIGMPFLPYDCGRAMTCQLRGAEAKKKDIDAFNSVMDKLCAIDPAAPKTRYGLDIHGRVITI